MKKYFIFAAAALVSLAACSKVNTLEVSNAEEDAIGFSAYTGTAATKGTSYAVTDVVATTSGIGVFAFYQPSGSGDFNTKKYATPDFMYNQQVKPHSITYTAYADSAEYNAAMGTSISAAEFNALSEAQKAKSCTVDYWEYSPVKYWPNNDGDKLSFFAYAPYQNLTTWEDLGFKTDVNATKLTASFPVYNEKESMVDYLFATPALNKTKQKVAVSPATVSAEVINFDFRHIMSRVAINIGAIVDKVPATTPEAFPAPASGTGTTITVESIEFKDVAEKYDYTYDISAKTASWEANGHQNIKLTEADFSDNNKSTKWTEAKWYPLLATEGTASKPGFLFFAPQDEMATKNIVITYTVATTDASNPANNSTITNVVEKPIGIEFKTGNAYVLNLLIGMKTVELSASLTDWTVAAAQQINVPANE